MADLLIASAGDDIKLWDAHGFDLVKQYNPHGGKVTSLCWSHDGSVSFPYITGSVGCILVRVLMSF